MKALMIAIKGVLDNYETPDSPEGLDAAMHLLRSEYELAEIRLERVRRKQSLAGKTTSRKLSKREARRIALLRWGAGAKTPRAKSRAKTHNVPAHAPAE